MFVYATKSGPIDGPNLQSFSNPVYFAARRCRLRFPWPWLTSEGQRGTTSAEEGSDRRRLDFAG
jgi:hypothetical protein